MFGALGVGIGFGLQNVVNNFVSGLILMFERPIQPGDTVEITGTTGTVREIGMRATTLKTREGADVVIPNGTLLSEKLINWTMSDMNRRVDVDRRRRLRLGSAQGGRRCSPKSRRTCTGIAAQPAPAVIFKGFGASSLDFGIRAWTRNFGDWVAIRSELAMRVHDALRRGRHRDSVPAAGRAHPQRRRRGARKSRDERCRRPADPARRAESRPDPADG